MQYPPYFATQFQQRPPSTRVEFNWLGESFELFKQQTVVWIVTVLIMGAGIMVVSAPFQVITQLQMAGITPNPTLSPSQQVLAIYARMVPMMLVEYPFIFLMSAFLMSGALRMAVMQVKGLKIEASDIFRGWPNTLRMLGLYLMMFVVNSVIFSPLVMLFIFEAEGALSTQNAYLLAGAFVLFFLVIGTLSAMVVPAFVLIADGEKVFRAIGRSFSAMKHDWIRACLLLFVYAIIYYVSAIPCMLGLFVSIPMAFLMLALCYRDMMEMPAPQFAAPPPINPEDYQGVWPPPPGQQ
jgi:hypothetical protein